MQIASCPFEFSPEAPGSVSLTNYPLLEIQTGPTDFFALLELAIGQVYNSNNSTTGSLVVGIGIPAARGVGINGAALGIENSELTDALPQINCFTAWSKAPTAPTNYMRRMTISPSTASSPLCCGEVFRFPKGIKIGPSSSLVLFQISAAFSVFNPWLDVNISGDS